MRIIVCEICKEKKKYFAKNKCKTCYVREKYHEMYPLSKYAGKRIKLKCKLCGYNFELIPWKVRQIQSRKNHNPLTCSPECRYALIQQKYLKHCKCGCGNILINQYEKRIGFRAYHDKERIKKAQIIKAKKAIINTQKKLIKRYGVDNPSQVPGAMEKRRKTWLKKYGTINVASLIKSPTSIEIKMKKVLESLNLDFEEYFKLNGWVWDFCIPNKRVLIECDGDYWHNYPTGSKSDHIKNKWVKNNNWKLLRFWERDINKNIELCEQKVRQEVM